MKSKRSIWIYISSVIVLAAAGIIIYFSFTQSPPEKTVRQFLSALMEKNSYIDCIEPQLINHPFIEFFNDENVKGYKIVNTDSTSHEPVRIWVNIRSEKGEAHSYFDAVRRKNKWVITRLPDIKIYNHGIPIEKTTTERGIIKWKIDIGGELADITSLASTKIDLSQPIHFSTMDGSLMTIYKLQPVSLTRVMSITNTVLEDMNLGFFDIQGRFPVFIKNNEGLSFLGDYNIPIGERSVIMYATDDNIGRMAIVSRNESYAAEKNIRVILQKTNYAGLLHSEIKVSGSGSFKVEAIVNSKSFDFNAGDTVVFKPSGNKVAVYKNGQELASSIFRWYIIPEENTRLKVLNIARSHAGSTLGTPYRGTLEVAAYNGELTLINEVSLEEYLYSVVPSEMPVKFGLEALKVQAIAARSYAVRAMRFSGYRFYGAHLDDSTASQVYNNTIEDDIAIFAVDDTAGLVPFYNNDVVDTRFFSTSCGYTANFHEVWSNKENEFPSQEIHYLAARPQYTGNAPSLYNEENFRAFINQRELPGYDKFSAFFRWDVTISREQLEVSLNKNLPLLYNQQPAFVLTRGRDGNYKSIEVPENVGKLLNIEVLKRGEGGNIMEMEISTTYGVFKIIKEYNIRQALKPVNYMPQGRDIELNCYDGSVRKNFALLPSAFAYINFERDIEGNIKDIIIVGGGYGHGVGMSQYGTYGLTLLGKTHEQIIEHFYPDSKLINIYE